MLDPESNRLHVVDGNAFLLNLFQHSKNGFVTRNTLDLVEKLKLPPVFVFDGKGGNERRRSRYPAYKTKRTPPGEDVFASIRLFRAALEHTKALQVQVNGWEADDVVATIANDMADNHKVQIRVVTVDRDLAQLAINSHIEVTAKYEHVTPHHVRLYKSTVGDPSDNITGIPRFGEKSWTLLNKPKALCVMQARKALCSAEELNLGAGHALFYQERFDDWLLCWDIVGLFQVPQELISKATVIGKSDPRLRDLLLKEFML